MIKKSIAPALLCTLLSSTALAGELVIDIATPGPITDATVAGDLITDTPGSTHQPILDFKFNGGVVTSTTGVANNTDLDAPLNFADVDQASPAIEGNVISVTAAANARADDQGNYLGNNLNLLDFLDTSAEAPAEALIGSVNFNNGTVTSIIDTADWSVNANDVTESDIGINNNSLTSRAIINGQNNYINGDVSSREASTSSAGPGIVDLAAETGFGAGGDFVIAAYQRNALFDDGSNPPTGGSASSTVTDLDMTYDINSLGTETSLTTQGNKLFAITEVNFLNNVIDIAHLGMDRDFAIGALQENAGTADAQITEIYMTMDVDRSVEGDMSISNNEFMATANVNNMTNQVVSDSGSGDANIFITAAQSNTGAVTSLIDVLYLDMAGAADVEDDDTNGDDVNSGNMLVNGNIIAAISSANDIVNVVTSEGSGDGLIDLNNTQKNSAAIKATVTDVGAGMTANATLSGDMSIANNNIGSYAYANIITSSVTRDNSGTGGVDFDLAQINEAAVSSTAEDLNLSMGASSADATTVGDMSVMNNTVTANALANFVFNDITYGGSSTSGNALASTQFNSGDLTATIQKVNMGITVAGVTSSNVGVRNNTITASAVANSATNIIRLR